MNVKVSNSWQVYICHIKLQFKHCPINFLFIEYYLRNMLDCHIFVNLFLFSIVIVQFLFLCRVGSYIGNIYWDYISWNIHIQNMYIHIQPGSRQPNLNLFTVFKQY